MRLDWDSMNVNEPYGSVISNDGQLWHEFSQLVFERSATTELEIKMNWPKSNPNRWFLGKPLPVWNLCGRNSLIHQGLYIFRIASNSHDTKSEPKTVSGVRNLKLVLAMPYDTMAARNQNKRVIFVFTNQLWNEIYITYAVYADRYD